MNELKVNFKINDEIISLEIPVDGSDHLFKIMNDDQYAVNHLFQLINTGFIHLKECVSRIQRIDDNDQIESTIYNEGLPLLEIEDGTERQRVGDFTQTTFENDKGRKIWGYNETLQLIDAIGSHYNDIISASPKIKKKGWQNILNVLTSFKIESTIDEIKKKWSNLIQTYNKSKDLQTRTGRGPTRFQFFENIDNIVGNKPTNSCSFSMDLGSATQTSTELGQSSTQLARASTRLESPKTTVNEETTRTKDDPSCIVTSQTEKRGRKRKNYTMEYFKAKKEFLQLKEKEMEKKASQKEEDKKKKGEESREKLEIEKKKLELEERKVKALEAYVCLQEKKYLT